MAARPALPKKGNFSLIFLYFFDLFSKYLAPSGAKYCEKGLAAIGKGFGKVLGKLNFQAVIKSAASAASLIAWGEPGRRLRLAGDGFGALPKQSGRLR